ncbi:hypothetical protein FHR92_001232 [Fontibacillus solani]|uniref:Nucleotidyltransferase-like domain-containing protein n=1 Tax=Fontibacillus solani TaxID=1572857 RepID=A0A7W3XQU9_9BACL|nr:nucleotidyltransferase-like protein [Fontibacillus solani]MBA9084771.1 hypothetical protein [Fontibacillus solani]
MEPSIVSLIDNEKVGRQVIGAISLRGDGMIFYGSLLHDFDLLILVVCCDIGLSSQIKIEHCVNGKLHYQRLIVGRNDLKQWVIEGQNREIVQCFLHGNVILDKDGKLSALRQDLLDFGSEMREQRKLNEYAKLLNTFVEAKKYTQDNDLMDAYYCVLQALKHYARIELIEQGILPENSVWEQARPINSVAYKLFDELTDNKETLEQRVQLVLLASEFSVMSKMEDCCSLLLNLLGSRKSAWSIQELVEVPELIHIKAELPMMLRKLVYRSLVTEVTIALNNGQGDVREIRYLA